MVVFSFYGLRAEYIYIYRETLLDPWVQNNLFCTSVELPSQSVGSISADPCGLIHPLSVDLIYFPLFMFRGPVSAYELSTSCDIL
jgi:hypothetical protein